MYNDIADISKKLYNGNIATSHKNGSFKKELKALLSAISSSDGLNEDAIKKFKKARY